MTRSRFDTPGGAAKCTLHASMDNSQTTFTLDGDVSNWSTGAGSHHFMVIVERGTSRMEKFECTALSGSSPATVTIAGGGRGYDGSVAQTHAMGVTAEIGFGGLYVTEHEAHLFDTTRDDHGQYIKTDGSRAFTGVGSIAGTPTSVGTANAAGSALTFARSDHVHQIGSGAITTSAQVAAGAIVGTNLAVGAVGTTQLASGAVVATTIGTNVIVSSNISSAAVVATTVAANVLTTGQLTATTMPIVSVTSTTHPSTTTIGNTIVETDTFNLLHYTTSTTGYQPPWNIGWGEVKAVVDTSGNHDATNTTIDLLTAITFTAVANRVYKFEFHCGEIVPVNATAGEVWKVILTDNSNGVVEYMGEATWATGIGNPDRDRIHLAVRMTGISAGSHTYKIRGAHIGSHTTRFISAASGTEPGPMWCSVQDVGPSTTPA